MGASLLALWVSSSGGVAHATSVEEFPDNGSEQEGRGGAWVARASDPLATFYNPAGLAGQPTRLTLQSNLSSQHTCFARVKATNDTTADGVSPGATYPKVCEAGRFFPDPQLAFTVRLSDRIGLGIALLAPSAVGQQSWPEFVDGSAPSPERYLLISTSSLLVTPALGVGWQVLDGLRVGASFIFGTAPSLDFVSATPSLNQNGQVPANNDIRDELKARAPFFPGFTVGVLWSPARNLDVAAWYKWMSDVNAKGDVETESNYFTAPVAGGNKSGVFYGDTAEPYCYTLPAGATLPGPPPCGGGNNASVKLPIPMEAKLGVRYHKPRRDVPYDAHRRDPLAQDVFDIEADFTWANDSAFSALQVRFPGDAQGNGVIQANPGIPLSFVPPNADVLHELRDVFGVRVGGDYNILPDQLALRAGAFLETQAANTTYQNVDFDGATRFGLALGGTYRIARSLDMMAGYGHVFFGVLSNGNPGAQGLPGVAGTACLNGAANPDGSCANGAQRYRTVWPVNLGTITSSINVINLGLSYRFDR